MRGLIVKDICLMKGQAKFMLLILAVTIFLSYNTDGTFAASYLVMIASFLGISTISYDETDNGYGFLFCLPVSRSQYVAAKYLFNLLLSVAAWIAGIGVTVIIWLVHPGESGLTELLITNLFFLPVIFLIQSLMQPTMFQYGSERGRIVLFVVIGGIVAVCYLIGKLCELTGIDLSSRIDSLSQYSMGVILLVLMLLSAMILLISIPISVKIIRKKEF